jgi:hypothetical protein
MKKSIFFTMALCCITATLCVGQTINNVGPAYFPSAFFPFNSQLQTAQNNVLMIQGNNVAGANPLRNNIRVGIGVFPTGPGPVDRLHINNINSVAVNMRITNGATGATATDGFFAGIQSTGLALLSQQENNHMQFRTNALDRMIITSTGLVGVNTLTPNNQVEINSSFGSCFSGLRFTQLVSACTPVANPGPGVLAVNATGDVIYVPEGSIGGPCGSATALTSNREVPMSGFNLNFTMPLASASQMNLGFPACTTIVSSRFTVNNDFHTTAGGFLTTASSGSNLAAGAFRTTNLGTGNATGVTSAVLTSNTGATAIAVAARSIMTAGFSSFYSIGLNSLTGNASFASIGVNTDVISSNSPLNFGVQSELQFNTTTTATNIGGEFIVSSNAGQGVPGGSTNIGVRALVPTATGGAGPDWAGLFLGDLFGSGTFQPSDRNLKKEINPVENSIGIIQQLKPVNYFFDTQSNPNMGLATTKQWGFISQEVQEVLPELTKQTTITPIYDSTGKVVTPAKDVLTLNYNGFIAILTAAIQEQQKLIEAQQQQIDQLTALVQGQTYNPVNNTVNEQDVTLTNNEVVVLDQNAPNPFTNQTIINYYIPQNVSVVQVQFFDMNGKMIKLVDISERGAGRLVVYAGDLSDGVYSYSLIIDGNVVDTKKMVKTE